MEITRYIREVVGANKVTPTFICDEDGNVWRTTLTIKPVIEVNTDRPFIEVNSEVRD